MLIINKTVYTEWLLLTNRSQIIVFLAVIAARISVFDFIVFAKTTLEFSIFINSIYLINKVTF